MKYTGDGDLPQVTDGMLQEALQGVRPYTIVVLKSGPNYSMPGPDRDPSVEQTVWEHGKRNFALRMAGLMPIICPVADGSGVSGVGIFDASPEETDLIMSRDPGVHAGLFTYDIHATRSFPGSSLPAPAAAVDPSEDA